MSRRIDSKATLVRNHLLRGNSITPLHSMGLYGLFRLAPAIQRMRDELFILTAIRTAPTGVRYAEYSIPTPGTEVLHTEVSRGVGRVLYVNEFFMRVEWPHAQRNHQVWTVFSLIGQRELIAV